MTMYVGRDQTQVYGHTPAITGARQDLARRMMAWLEAAEDLRRTANCGPILVDGPALAELGAIVQELRDRTTRARLDEATPRELLAASLDALLDSVSAFNHRFGLTGQASREDLADGVGKIAEETLELHVAIADESINRVAQEAADVLYVAAGTLLLLPWRVAKLGLGQVIAKNNAKNPDTYRVNEAGKAAAQ